MNQVPTLDISRYDAPATRTAFVADLGAAYREFGFCCITGHGIPAALIDAAYDDFRRFFALPEAVKRRYHIPGGGGTRGYTPFKIETAKDSRHPDLKEFWHIGREIPRDSRHAPYMPANLWPDEVAGFREHGYALYQALDLLGSRVLSALAVDLQLPSDYFAVRTDSGNSILRPLHYPPIDDAQAPNLRAGAHEDINLITLLVGASAEGLEILTRQNRWLPVTTQGDAIVVNIGDMLQRLTNHVYRSTTHRVVNPPGERGRVARYSVPFFLHLNPDVVIDVLPGCVSAGNPNRYPQPISAHDYLMQRLEEIRLL